MRLLRGWRMEGKVAEIDYESVEDEFIEAIRTAVLNDLLWDVSDVSPAFGLVKIISFDLQYIPPEWATTWGIAGNRTGKLHGGRSRVRLRVEVP